ncbi:Hypothetical Protein FCC1311_010702 [Hondaea fermentalgiana]|uniref:AP2/ERF domain-containing protein n=1 Tax=Hondaea fermentalgiana TaxID=2315210 RepID=A0A2R5G1I4_9STRA|nr:Hypothetical Protein FCC1311_010702 [Hondaea fermentalgiana]|eukprot:GBG24852.1 Hypothetical Protein FCC1311_010702 [Hondaea fermentalgiana]
MRGALNSRPALPTSQCASTALRWSLPGAVGHLVTGEPRSRCVATCRVASGRRHDLAGGHVAAASGSASILDQPCTLVRHGLVRIAAELDQQPGTTVLQVAQVVPSPREWRGARDFTISADFECLVASDALYEQSKQYFEPPPSSLDDFDLEESVLLLSTEPMRKKPRKESNSRDVARTNTDASAVSPPKAPLMSPRQVNSFSFMAQSAEASANDPSQPMSASEWSRLDGNTNHFGSPNFNQGSGVQISPANKLQWSSSGTSSSSVTPTPSTTSSEATEQQAINQRGNTNSHARGQQEASSSSSGNLTAQQSSLGHDLVNKESNEPEVPKQSSAYKGVSWHKRDRRWTARAWVDRRTVHLGAYASEEVAAAVVDFKLLQRYRQMASTGRPPRLNFASDADRLALLERSLTDARSDLPTLITTLRISGVDADTDRLLLRLDARLKETSSSASSSSSSSSGTRKEQKQAQPATGTTTDTSLTPASSSSTSQPSGSQFLSSASTSSARKMPKVQREKERASGTGRGKEVSKAGAGGKYTWGAPGSEGAVPPMSKRDPNYDSDEDQ